MAAFRNYTDSVLQARVQGHYQAMRTHQTVAFYEKMEAKYDFGQGKERAHMTIREAFKALETYVDSSGTSMFQALGCGVWLVACFALCLFLPLPPPPPPKTLPHAHNGARCMPLHHSPSPPPAPFPPIKSTDPDLDLPNLVHMLQTAEGIRKAGHPDWFQLVGLLHDMGKIQFLWGQGEDGQQGTADGPQWALGGDTWVVGCAIPDSVVFPAFNRLNRDMGDARYNTANGMYAPGCGVANLKWAWGHDEYMYRMLVANGTTLPAEGLAMIRYHSAYPWHDKGEYRQFMAEGDAALLGWVAVFNQFDLYTKDAGNAELDVEALWPYYQGLIEKYLPAGPLRW